jgi:hypothetical protein
MQTKIQENRESHPGVTMYQSTPAAQEAKATRATFHSHTAAVEQRDGCNMVRRKAPGFALATRSTGDPAFRFAISSPSGQLGSRLSEEP